MGKHLFRGKNPLNQWEYWDEFGYIEGCNDCRISYDDIPNKDTIGRFTGLCDKNGKKIFEGDNIDPSVKRWYVAHATGQNESLGMSVGWYLVRDNFESWMELRYEDYYEVIGNIHDNPELLER